MVVRSAHPTFLVLKIIYDPKPIRLRLAGTEARPTVIMGGFGGAAVPGRPRGKSSIQIENGGAMPTLHFSIIRVYRRSSAANN
jgi:hypothetical protein